jgi:hypothetical protein
MIKGLSIVTAVALVCLPVAVAEEPGLMGHWDFDAGNGLVLRDLSGHGNHGKLHGPKWVANVGGHALRFDGEDDYVDCGNDASLDIRGPMTLSAWVCPLSASAREPGIVGKYFASYALTYYRGGCWWYISSGGNNASAPLSKTGVWSHVTGTFDGETLILYVNGREVAKNKSKTASVNQGDNFLMGRIVPSPDAPGAASQARGQFDGLIDEVKVYDRPLSLREVIAEYNRQAEQKGLAPRDTSWFDRFCLKAYHYPERRKVVVSVDYRGLLPMAEGSRLAVELRRTGDDDSIAKQEIAPDSEEPSAEVTFSLDNLPSGEYELRAVLDREAERVTEETIPLVHPRPERELPNPREEVAAALPSPNPPVEYGFSLAPGGGFLVRLRGVEYPVESSYSFPHGGSNRLIAADQADRDGEPDWKVTSRTVDDTNYRVTATGKHYSIERQIALEVNRIVIRDTCSNKMNDVVGIILDNHIDMQGKPIASVEMPKTFTFFISAADHGLGMVGLDDFYQVQQETWVRSGVASMVCDKFGLDSGASYTIEWAVYPTSTGDYFDFINTVRKVEELNRTVEGAFGLIGDGEGLTTAADRRVPPSPMAVDAKNMKYVSYFYLIAPADDPGMSLEGIEFTEYPKESALLKKAIAETHRLNPGIKATFHIAHGLYATNRPEALFPDSRVVDANGNFLMYGPNSADYYCRYFSPQRFDDGNRWWIFFPTMENSFGKAMLDAIDYMLNDIGASAMYADGFVSGYARGHTCNAWDGQSVEIDPVTKCVKRKMGNVTLMSLPVLKAVTRKVAAKGGVVITNGQAGPRSLWKEHYFTTCETSGGDQLPICRLHLGPTVTAFGDPTRIKDRRGLYLDFLDKLDWGALYFYYGDRGFSVDEKMLIRHMYPFTLEELHAGWIKGRERIVTKVSGVYGWRGDRQMHKVYRSDSRGILVSNFDFSTADAEGVRTELRLEELESAVVERIPIELSADGPVNFLVKEYGADGLSLVLNGRGNARLALRSGALAIEEGGEYLVVAGKAKPVRLTAGPTLVVPLEVDGKTECRISPAD